MIKKLDTTKMTFGLVTYMYDKVQLFESILKLPIGKLLEVLTLRVLERKN